MLNPVRGFILSLFNLFIVYIVLFNFLGWTGFSPNILGDATNGISHNAGGPAWDTTYFGFESLISCVNDFDRVLGAFGKAGQLSFLKENAEKLLNYVMGGIPAFLGKIASGSANFLDAVSFIVTLLVAPLMSFGYAIMCLITPLCWLLTIIGMFFRLVGGAYNLPLDDTQAVWDQWSYLSSEWSWVGSLRVI